MSLTKEPFAVLMKQYVKIAWALIWPFILLAIISFAIIYGIHWDREKKIKKASEHIKTVIAIDKNCNECHLGESFINLFSHYAVKENDNVINSIMDKAHIKRW